MFFDRPDSGQRAVLVHVRFSSADERDAIAEFEELVRSADIEIAETVLARRRAPQSRVYVGEGKVEEIKAAVLRRMLREFSCGRSPAQAIDPPGPSRHWADTSSR